MANPPQPPTPPTPPPPYAQSRAQWRAQRAQWKMQARAQRAAYRAAYRGSVRGSLLGPLFLIVIGVIALLMTLHKMSAPAFWQWYGHWWPLLLIGAGLLLMLESVVWARHFRIRLGGGAILLLILLAIIGFAASHNHVNWSSLGDQLQLGNNLDLAQIFGSKHEASEQIIHALPAKATLVIQNGHGDVTMTTSSDDQMHLNLDKTVYTDSDRDAKRELSELEPLITSSGSVVTVHMPSGDREVADMNLAVPANTAVQLRTDRGDVTVSGRQAAVTIDSSRGDVELSSIVGPVQVTMHQGDFSANNLQGDLTLNGRMGDVALSKITGSTTLTGDFFGDVHLEQAMGPLHFHSSRTDIQVARLDGSVSLDDGDLGVDNATGPVSVSTRAMDISLQRIHGDVRVSNSDGSIAVKMLDPVGAMNLKNRNGSVHVTVPQDAKFSVNGVASDGEITSDFQLSIKENSDRSVASGSVGGGGPLLNLVAEKGDITLRKAAPGASQ